jgi:hypothetical protein
MWYETKNFDFLYSIHILTENCRSLSYYEAKRIFMNIFNYASTMNSCMNVFFLCK